MATSNEVSPARAAGSRSVRAALVACAVAVLSLGALYWSYYTSRSEYLVDRDLRLLSVASAQVGESLESHKQIVRNFAETSFWCSQGKPILIYPSRGTDNLKPYLADFTDLRRGEPAESSNPPGVTSNNGFSVRLDASKTTVSIEYKGIGSAAGKQNPDECPLTGPPHAVGLVPLDGIIKKVFDKPLFSVFDDIFVASASDDPSTASKSAEILEQVQPHSAQAQRGISARGNRSVANQNAPGLLVLANLTGIRDRDTKDGDLNVDLLRRETRSSNVEIAGRRYFLLTQPIDFEGHHWIIGGLVDRQSFISDATEISMSLIELAVAALVLLVCCWPFLKVAFSGKGEPVTRADVVMGGVATLLAGGMIALLLVDLFAYNHIETVADDQQRAFAAAMVDDLRAGMNSIVQAAEQMRGFTAGYAAGYQVTETTQGKGITHSSGDFKRDPQSKKLDYTYFSEVAWVNDLGDQVVQVAMQGGPPPLPSVARRQYFRALVDADAFSHSWTWVDRAQSRHEFVIEPVRALATGASQAVIAFPVRDPKLPSLKAFTVTFPFVEATQHLVSPDITYAIVDGSGNVMFGSDPDRNQIENVFTETDQNRQLRAAVGARQEDFVETKYWGEDTQVLVTPLSGMPWTLLTFRDKRLLRTMNLETLVITMTLFLIHLGVMVFTVVAVLLLRPSYRIPWVWPAESRLLFWKRVRLLYGVSVAAFILVICCLVPAARLGAVVLVPFHAFLSSYLILDDRTKRLAYGLSIAAWMSTTVILTWGSLKAPVAPEVIARDGAIVLIRLALLLCLMITLFCVLIRPKELERVRWREFARTYVACGVLFVILISILPMIACFQAALTIELEALVKSGQRRMADMFLQRIELLAQTSWADAPRIARSYPIPFFYESFWCIQPAEKYISPCGDASTARLARLVPTESFRFARNDVGDLIEEYLPIYTEGSMELRALQSGKAADNSWFALRARRVMALSRNLDLSYPARQKLIAEFQDDVGKLISTEASARWMEQINDGRAQLTIVSRLPSMLPEWLRPTDPIRPFPREDKDFLHGEARAVFPAKSRDPVAPPWLVAAAFVLAAIVACGLLVWAVRFAARRIFLYDLREPRWLDTPLKQPLGEHLFLVHAPGNLSTLICLEDVQQLSFNDLRDVEPYFDELGLPPNKWAAHLARIDGDRRRAILCKGFGDDLGDIGLTRRKFAFIESMLRLTDCTIIISSPVSPALFLNLYGDLDADTRARWEKVLAGFVWIDETRLLPRAAAPVHDDTPVPSAWERAQAACRGLLKAWSEGLVRLKAGNMGERIQKNVSDARLHLETVRKRVGMWFMQFTAKGREARDRADDEEWITRETAPSPFLLTFADRLRSLPGGRTQMLDELREGAERYYQALWTMCSQPERVALYHVAHYGVANANNRSVLRRLVARGLLRRDGELHLFNSTFRQFVLARAGEIREQCEMEPESRSTFDRVRVPMFVAILVILAVIVGTQKELANATGAILTALATGLPMIVKLIGTFTDRRVVTAES
jgi:hypothetical protein